MASQGGFRANELREMPGGQITSSVFWESTGALATRPAGSPTPRN